MFQLTAKEDMKRTPAQWKCFLLEGLSTALGEASKIAKAIWKHHWPDEYMHIKHHMNLT